MFQARSCCSRFVCCVCCSARWVDIVGSSRMHQRPIHPLVDCLRSMGAHIEYLQCTGFPPLRIFGGGLAGGDAVLESSISSQFASALLMVGPLYKLPLRLTLTEEVPTSFTYIQMTIQNMRQFGLEVQSHASNTFHVPSLPYVAPAHVYTIEPDASSATYAATLAAISARSITFPGIGSDSLQGAKLVFCSLIVCMPCRECACARRPGLPQACRAG